MPRFATAGSERRSGRHHHRLVARGLPPDAAATGAWLHAAATPRGPGLIADDLPDMGSWRISRHGAQGGKTLHPRAGAALCPPLVCGCGEIGRRTDLGSRRCKGVGFRDPSTRTTGPSPADVAATKFRHLQASRRSRHACHTVVILREPSATFRLKSSAVGAVCRYRRRAAAAELTSQIPWDLVADDNHSPME